MADERRQKISANQILADIRSGMADDLLKKKYGLSDKGLDSVYRKLVRIGYLSEGEILYRSNGKPTQDQSIPESPLDLPWKCPSCNTPQASEMDECPVCGIVTAKFKARQEAERSFIDSTAHITYTGSSGSGIRMAAVVALAIVLAGGAFAVWVQLMDEQEPGTGSFKAVRLQQTTQHHPNKNALAIKDRANSEELEIELQPLSELDFMSKAQVYSIRKQAVSRYPQLVSGEYRPSDAVFGQIVDGLPWWGGLGAYQYGSGKKSIAGPSTHSLSILNPYLLVAASFNLRRLDPGTLATLDEHTGYQQFYCLQRTLRWEPRRGRVEVTYDAECLRRGGANAFWLYAYNARDFNQRYIYVSYQDSLNILKENEPAGAYANPQYIHQGGSCGYPGGCNNMSPATPPIDNIQIFSWPVRVVIRLWEKDPGPVTTPPDVEYIMHFK